VPRIGQPKPCFNLEVATPSCNCRINASELLLHLLLDYQHTRFFAFFVTPTEENPNLFNAESDLCERSPVFRAKPFLYFSHNGHASQVFSTEGVIQLGCPNGVEHGRFGTALENRNQNGWNNLSSSKCPGRWSLWVFCIYVHPNGLLKPCLNLEDGIPSSCDCKTKCF
jgi:hypothetical protein